MTRKTLVIVLAFPLLLVVLAFVASISLPNGINNSKRDLVKIIQSNNAAVETIASGHLTPSKEQIAAIFRATADTHNAELKAFGDLWNVMVATFWLVISACLAHVVLCINIYLKQKQLQGDNPT